MNDIDKSDHMLYTNIAEMQFSSKRTNDSSYIYQMSKTIPKCLIDRGNELSFLAGQNRSKAPFCEPERGGNASGCEARRSCPHPEYSKYYMNEFLIVPCPKPTHKNYIVCGRDNCCSKQHQLFKNQTKRKDIVINRI